MEQSESRQEDKSQITRAKNYVLEFKELLIAIGAVITIVVLGMFWAQDVILNREREILERNAEQYSDLLIEKIVEKIHPLTADEFAEAFEEITESQEVIITLTTDFYLRNALRHDTLSLDIEAIQRENARILEALKKNELRLNRIEGIATLSAEEQRAAAYTDSLQNALLQLQTQQQTQNILRQMENFHKKEIDEMRRKTGKTKKWKNLRKPSVSEKL